MLVYPECEEFPMYVRVVRFTDVNAERMEGLLARIEDQTGRLRACPPPA